MWDNGTNSYNGTMLGNSIRNGEPKQMITMERRNKNADKTLIDWDLNIFMPEEYDAEKDDYFFDPACWKIHVYAYKEGNHDEWDEPINLTADEIKGLGLNRDSYFRDEVDVWYGLDGFRTEYWSKMSDRLKEYFDRLPKYWEDLNGTEKYWKNIEQGIPN